MELHMLTLSIACWTGLKISRIILIVIKLESRWLKEENINGRTSSGLVFVDTKKCGKLPSKMNRIIHIGIIARNPPRDIEANPSSVVLGSFKYFAPVFLRAKHKFEFRARNI